MFHFFIFIRSLWLNIAKPSKSFNFRRGTGFFPVIDYRNPNLASDPSVNVFLAENFNFIFFRKRGNPPTRRRRKERADFCSFIFSRWQLLGSGLTRQQRLPLPVRRPVLVTVGLSLSN